MAEQIEMTFWSHSFGWEAQHAKYVTLDSLHYRLCIFSLKTICIPIQHSGDAASSQITLGFLATETDKYNMHGMKN